MSHINTIKLVIFETMCHTWNNTKKTLTIYYTQIWSIKIHYTQNNMSHNHWSCRSFCWSWMCWLEPLSSLPPVFAWKNYKHYDTLTIIIRQCYNNAINNNCFSTVSLDYNIKWNTRRKIKMWEIVNTINTTNGETLYCIGGNKEYT